MEARKLQVILSNSNIILTLCYSNVIAWCIAMLYMKKWMDGFWVHINHGSIHLNY